MSPRHPQRRDPRPVRRRLRRQEDPAHPGGRRMNTTTARKTPSGTTPRTDPARRVRGFDWPTLTEEINAYGCAQTPQLLGGDECTSSSELYEPSRSWTGSGTVAH